MGLPRDRLVGTETNLPRRFRNMRQATFVGLPLMMGAFNPENLGTSETMYRFVTGHQIAHVPGAPADWHHVFMSCGNERKMLLRNG